MVFLLGHRWLPREDSFTFKTSVDDLTHSAIVTKRSIASDVAKLFDTSGWLSPVIIRSKVSLQNLWIEHLEENARIIGDYFSP